MDVACPYTEGGNFLSEDQTSDNHLLFVANLIAVVMFYEVKGEFIKPNRNPKLTD